MEGIIQIIANLDFFSFFVLIMQFTVEKCAVTLLIQAQHVIINPTVSFSLSSVNSDLSLSSLSL